MRAGRGVPQVDRLIARGSYARAIDLLERQLEENGDNVRLIQQLADLYARTGSQERSTELLLPLVDRFAEAGFVAKAIVVLKRIERSQPGREEVEERLAELIRQRQRETQQDPRRPGIAASSRSEPGSEEISLQEEVAPIVHSPLFSGFSTRELVALLRGLGLSTFEAGEIIVTEGQPGNSLFVLASGSVRIYVRDGEGCNRQVRRLSPPEFFGEVSLFEGSPRTATVVAATDCELLRLDRATLATIAAKHPTLPRALQRAYSERAGSDRERQARGFQQS